MEMEFFVKPGTDEKWFEYWLDERFNWYLSLGIKQEHLGCASTPRKSWRTTPRPAPTSSTCSRWAGGELEGIANRGDFDLTAALAGQRQSHGVFRRRDKGALHPYVIEPSAGVDRSVLAFLCDAYDEEPDKDEIRVVLHLHPARADQGRHAAAQQERDPGALAKDVHATCAPCFDDRSTTIRRASAGATAARTRSARRSA